MYTVRDLYEKGKIVKLYCYLLFTVKNGRYHIIMVQYTHKKTGPSFSRKPRICMLRNGKADLLSRWYQYYFHPHFCIRFLRHYAINALNVDFYRLVVMTDSIRLVVEYLW